MPEKYLIVNADDYNTNRERNLGILQAAKSGIVTSVSVIANTKWDEHALSDLKETMGTHVGVHLNLTRGFPLTHGVKTLVDQSGRFLSKKMAWYRACVRGFDRDEVEEEFAAQINHLKGLGIAPDHLDGNNHIHVFPGIAEVVARLARDFGILRVRTPCESFTRWQQTLQPQAVKKQFIGALAGRAETIFQGYGLRSAEHFAGIQFPDVSKTASLREFIRNLPTGITELMCHPGYRSPTGSPFSTFKREQELEALTHLAVLEDIRRFKICLISYGEL